MKSVSLSCPSPTTQPGQDCEKDPPLLRREILSNSAPSPRAMPRPFKWAEYFNKDAALQNRSNKYQVSCIRCQKKIPKGRSEERTRHLVEECTGLTSQEREQIVQVEAKEAEAAAVGSSKPRGRPSGGGAAAAAAVAAATEGSFGDTEIEELSRLVRLHPLENDDQGWQVVFDEYNNWAEANGLKKRAGDTLKKQWYIPRTGACAEPQDRSSCKQEFTRQQQLHRYTSKLFLGRPRSSGPPLGAFRTRWF